MTDEIYKEKVTDDQLVTEMYGMKKTVIHDADFPFDLNNLFNLQYSFDTLKSAIEFLAK